jgi:hypothetical protein
MTVKPQIPFCTTCKQTNVQCDSYSVWDMAKQEWVTESTYDKGAYCGVCDGETRLDFRDATPEEIAGEAQ